jgi:putative ABC transport system substrate-binding protein
VGSAAGVSLLAGCGRWPWQAQPTTKVPSIGVLSNGIVDDVTESAFREGLRDFGYVEGQNLHIEWRSAEGTFTRLPALAAELVQLPVDVIVSPSTVDVLAAKGATSTIPIVFVLAADPVGLGLVTSLPRPGGNVTGLSNLAAVLGQKRLELLKATAPWVSTVACLYDSTDPSSVGTMQGMNDAAQVLGVTLKPLEVRAADELDGVLDAAQRLPADALATTAGPLLVIHAPRIVEFAVSNRLPATYHNRSFVTAGGLMSYGTSNTAQFRRAAYYVDRILKGAKPADLPVEQPMTFDFVVNLKTARELGITFPNEIMLQVTEVIQ